MQRLSTKATDADDSSAESERSDWVVKVLVPVAVGLILIAAGFAERGPAQRDLQLVAPREALAGQTIPLRAYFLDLSASTPAPIADAEVDVVLRGLEGESQVPLVRVELERSEALGYEGALTLPDDASGTLQLFATARAPGLDDEALDEARRRITIGTASRGAPRLGRLQTPLQRYELGSRTAVAGSEATDPPEHLEPRVLHGVCTNHAPCELLVWVGAPAASIALTELAGASDPDCEPGATDGFVRCTVQVAGNEANLVVVARRGDGVEVARRWVQLPMGSPAPAVRRDQALVPVGARPTLHVFGLDDRYVVDLFHEGRWQRTATVAPEADGALELPWPLDAPGLWRAQVRRDVFGSRTAAVATFFVGDDLRALAEHPRQNDWLDPTAAAVRAGDLRCDGGPCDPQRLAAFMLAAGELEVVTYPRSSSGAEQASAGIRTVQWGRRGVAAGLIFLAGLLVAFVVHRRASAAGVQARQILASAKEEEAEPGGRDAVPAASAAFLVLIFAVVAAIVLARGCLIG